MALYSRCFGSWSAKRFEQRWRWQYEANPYCRQHPAFVQVGLAGKRAVAHLGAFPLPLRLADRRCVALCAADLVTDTGYGWAALQLLENCTRKGPLLGTGLSEAAMKLFCYFGGRVVPLSRQRFVYRLRYRAPLCQNLRWHAPPWIGRAATPRILGLFDRWVAARRNVELRPVPLAQGGLDVRPIRRFEASYDALWERATRLIRYSIDKTSEYMNWRYVDCPTANPIRLGAFDARGRLTDIVVAAAYAEIDRYGRPCGTSGEILELIGDGNRPRTLEGLVVAAMRELARRGADTIGATGLTSSLHPLLERIGYVREESDRFVMGLRLDSVDALDESLQGEGWYTTAGDGDALYATAL